MSEQDGARTSRYETAMDQDSWIARHKNLAALLIAMGGPAGFSIVWLLAVIL